MSTPKEVKVKLYLLDSTSKKRLVDYFSVEANKKRYQAQLSGRKYKDSEGKTNINWELLTISKPGVKLMDNLRTKCSNVLAITSK